MKNKFVLIIAAVLFVGAAFLFAFDKLGFGGKQEEPAAASIDDVVKSSVEVQEIATNLRDDRYVKISFMIETDSKDAKSELEKRQFQVKNIIITELSEMKADELDGKEGKQQFQNMLKSRINEKMQDGEVVQVYITSYIIS